LLEQNKTTRTSLRKLGYRCPKWIRASSLHSELSNRVSDGEDIIVFSVVYPADLDSNQTRSGFIKNIEGCLKLKGKTLKFKAIRMSIDDLGKILD
jgi:hypothetical protein